MPRREPWRHIVGGKKEQINKIRSYGQRNNTDSHRSLREKSSRGKDGVAGWANRFIK